MMIPTQYIKYLAIAAGLILVVAFAAERYSTYRVGRLERAVATSATAAETQARRAAELEQQSAGYREKITYLEDQISQIGEIARRQDEELKLHARRTDSARGDVHRARSIRAINATTDELCKKLAELGHGCE